MPEGEAGREDSRYQVVLDDRPVRTPRKQALAVPQRALAEAIAAEWNAQGQEIDPVVRLLHEKGLRLRKLVEKRQSLEELFVSTVEGAEPGTDRRRPAPPASTGVRA